MQTTPLPSLQTAPPLNLVLEPTGAGQPVSARPAGYPAPRPAARTKRGPGRLPCRRWAPPTWPCAAGWSVPRIRPGRRLLTWRPPPPVGYTVLDLPAGSAARREKRAACPAFSPEAPMSRVDRRTYTAPTPD